MHVGYIKKFLYFVYDPATKSVVVGPAALNKVSDPTVPELHEHGGTSQIKEYQLSGGKWTRINFGDKDRTTRLRTAEYPTRSFMKPAMDAELPKAPQHFKNTFIR